MIKGLCDARLKMRMVISESYIGFHRNTKDQLRSTWEFARSQLGGNPAYIAYNVGLTHLQPQHKRQCVLSRRTVQMQSLIFHWAYSCCILSVKVKNIHVENETDWQFGIQCFHRNGICFILLSLKIEHMNFFSERADSPPISADVVGKCPHSCKHQVSSGRCCRLPLVLWHSVWRYLRCMPTQSNCRRTKNS